MYGLLISLSVIISIILIVAVLMQASKGAGLAGTFGGSNIGTVFGARRTADFLGKITWWLAGILVFLAVLINLFFLPSVSGTDAESIIQRGGQQSVPTQPTVPQVPPQQ